MLVEDQSFTLTAGVDTHFKALDDLSRTLLEHAPGMHRSREKRYKVQAWLLCGVTRHVDVSATAQQQAANQQKHFVHVSVSSLARGQPEQALAQLRIAGPGIEPDSEERAGKSRVDDLKAQLAIDIEAATSAR
ncbi:hypothetical protein D3C81_877600 [compost metagenome]